MAQQVRFCGLEHMVYATAMFRKQLFFPSFVVVVLDMIFPMA